MRINLNRRDLELISGFIQDTPTIDNFSLVRHSEFDGKYCLDLVYWVGTKTQIVPVIDLDDFYD